MLWKREEDWMYELFPLDENPQVFDRFSSFISLWRSKCINGKLPKWSNFELEDFDDWWGWVLVYDLEGEHRENIRVRLWGSQITNFMVTI